MSQNFMHEDKIKSNFSIVSLLKRMWPYTRRHMGLFALVLLCIAGLAITSRSLPFLIGHAIDDGIRAKDYGVLKTVALIYLMIQVMQTCFQFLYAYVFQRFGNRVLFYIREDLTKHIQSLPIQYFNKTPIGRVVTRLTTDVGTLADLFTDGVITIFVEFIILMSILIAMSMISVKLTLITMFMAPVFIWASIKISNWIRDILREAKKKLSELNSFVAENLTGIKVIQLYNRVPRNRSHFLGLSGEYRDLLLSSIRSYASMHPVMNIFNALTIALALYYGGVFHEQEGLALGAMVAFLMHAQDFISPLKEILEKYQEFQNSVTSGERVFQVFDEVPEKQMALVQTISQWRGQLELKNLEFRYEEHLPLVLKGIDLKVLPGQSVAIVGRTGSGKSTLISLLQRFYEPPANSIFIDGVDIEALPFHRLRRHVGVVQQDNFVFRGTIAENVHLLDPAITLEKVQKACDKIGYLELLKQSGRTLDSHVEERGANISVGERQLIAFARILAFEPDILILDEATANIDSQSEKIIQQATTEVAKGRTSLIIAHRLSTVQNCDVIVVMDSGKIVEKGNHAELMNLRGYYYQSASAGLKSTEILSSAPGTADP